MFNLFKKREAAAEATGEGRFLVYLFVTDDSWQAEIIDLHKERATQSLNDQGEALKALADLPKDHTAEQAIEQMFRLAGEALRKAEPTKIATIRIVIGDPGVLYTDTLPELFTVASTATLHEYGRANLRCRSVSYGRAKFGPAEKTPGRGGGGGVIAFIDAARLGSFLSRLDRLALKVRAVMPLSDILVRQGQAGHRSGPAAALHIGALSCMLVLSNPTIGAVARRVLPFGVIHLGRLLAEGSCVSLEEAMRSLAEQDLISELRTEEAWDDGLASLTSSPAERILGAPVRRFLADIAASLAFFEEQRCAGRPHTLEISGDIDRVRGLRHFLRENLSVGPTPLAVEFSERAVLDLVQSFPAEVPLNLLSAASGDLKIGAVNYTFHNDQLRLAEDLRRENEAREQQARPGQQRATPGRPGRPGRRGAPAAPAKPSLLGQLRGLLRGKGRAAGEGGDGPDDAAIARADQQGFALLALIVIAIVYQGVSWHSHAGADFQVRAAVLKNALDENVKHRTAVAAVGGQFHEDQDVDKVLWTEKILALSSHMTNEIWLTDLYLTTETRSLDKAAISTKKLVMEGAVLPSVDGHIQKIAMFIDALQKDNSQFMSDFKDITFEGLTLDTNEADKVVKFTIEAWYDAAKRQELPNTAAAASGTGGVSDATRAMEQHNQ